MRITIEIDETRPGATPIASVEPTQALAELAAPSLAPATIDALSAGASVENLGEEVAEAAPATGVDAADMSAGPAPDL